MGNKDTRCHIFRWTLLIYFSTEGQIFSGVDRFLIFSPKNVKYQKLLWVTLLFSCEFPNPTPSPILEYFSSLNYNRYIRYDTTRWLAHSHFIKKGRNGSLALANVLFATNRHRYNNYPRRLTGLFAIWRRISSYFWSDARFRSMSWKERRFTFLLIYFLTVHWNPVATVIVIKPSDNRSLPVILDSGRKLPVRYCSKLGQYNYLTGNFNSIQFEY